MVRIGTIVKIRSTNNKGIVLEINGNSAKVQINNLISSHVLSDLEEENLSLIDRLIKNEQNDVLDFILSINAYRLLIEYKFNPYVLASSTKINIFPHQIDEVIKILDNPRMMIADEVGLGKTIIAALVATELRERGLANKILFVVPKSLVIKWQEELKNRFETVSVIINSEYLKINNNPFKIDMFSYVTSIDFLKQQHIMQMIKDYNFDLVIVDEAHKLLYGTERFALGKVLSQRSNFLLFLTATPHNGDDEDFLQRMRLLDPYFHQISTTSHLMTRNIKEDVIDLDGKEVFPPRTSKTIDVDLSYKEIKLHKMVDSFINERLEEASNSEERNMIRFLTTIIRKRASSSFYALKNTLEKRKEKLGTSQNIRNTIHEMKRNEDDYDEEATERNEEEVIGFSTGNISKERQEITDILTELESLLHSDSKLQLLMNFIDTTKKTDSNAKMVIFSEYRDTINYIRDNLCEKYRVGSIDGTMNIEARNDALSRFRDTYGSEIMVCTDAAGEGIDMQFCNIEINYDLPWNPNKLEQRMDRIHRIGQNRNVYYYNFVINDTIDGYIIHKLLDKIENIKNAIGGKIYDVIGKRLVNEDEIMSLYEELLKLPKEKWDAKIKRFDGIIEEKKRILNQINELLLGYRLDRSKLEKINKNMQNVIDKEQVKLFVKKFLDYNGGIIESIDTQEEMYKIFLPKQVSIPSGSKTRIIEGCFNGDIAIKKGYTYFALGNPHIMGLVQHAAKRSVAILEHPNDKGLIMIYKIAVRDIKGRERDAKVIAFYYDYTNGNIKEISIADLWNYEYSSNSNTLYDKTNIAKDKDLVDVYADKYTNDLLKENAMRLTEIESRVEDSIIRYYSKQVEDINSKIYEYKEKISESPFYSKHIQKETAKIKILQNELRLKLDETKRDFTIIPVIELIGVAILDRPSSPDIKQYIEKPEMIYRLNEFSKQNQQINSEYSMTTHDRMQKNPSEWYNYHKRFEEIRKSWTIDPLEKIIQRLRRLSPRLRIGDFGCGKAKIMDVFGSNRVKSFDHIAINDKVTACDMRSLPLEDGYLDVIVFSLSLMGKNWHEYIVEASRCLMSTGTLIIADTVRSLTEGRLNKLKEVLLENGFDLYKEELWDIFAYLEARKK